MRHNGDSERIDEPKEQEPDVGLAVDSKSPASPPARELDLTRWELDAELRVNLIRGVGIAVFYLVHLWHVAASGLGDSFVGFWGMDEGSAVEPRIHLAVSLICLAWLMQAIVVHLRIAQRRPLGYWALGVTLGDLVCLTSILLFSTGPAGPMVAGYFLIILMAGMRHDLRLVRVATVAAIAGYAALLGFARWPLEGLRETGLASVPRYHQIMVILALIFAGILTGQIVRLGWSLSTVVNSAESGEDP